MENELDFGDVSVLLTVWSRPAMTYQVLSQLRKVKPPVIRILCDGPRDNVLADKIKVDLVREIIDRTIDWDCDIYRCYHEKNRGMSKVFVGPKFFNDKGEEFVETDDTRYIGLEDDDLPSVSFFKFCLEMLDKYEDDEDVWFISGNNFQHGRVRGDGSYYFSYMSHSWGSAIWSRKFNKFLRMIDELKDIFEGIMKGELHFPVYLPQPIVNYVMSQCNRVYNGDLKDVTNDFLRNLYVYMFKKLTILPNVNLVKNIGFCPVDGINCRGFDPKRSLDFEEMEFPLKHPKEIEPDFEADLYYFKEVIGIQGL